MQNPAPVQTAKSSTGLDENVAALLSYLFGWVSGLIFFLLEKDSRLVRFHAMQSILLNAAGAVIGFVLWIATFILAIIGAMLSDSLGALVWILAMLLFSAFGLALFVAAILCLVKAYQGQYFKLPVIGNFAEKFSTK
ncbi:MAG TPA: DUF4870 domain-containing protein [Pyrinomonadaceae bacterium]|nr:DUF4870 domain-containing protein [Pyrinomonadaceae bacterium]